jgi:hypothetical protein
MWVLFVSRVEKGNKAMNESRIEQKLLMLMDFQRFAEETELAQLLRQTKERYLPKEELADEDLELNAAGEMLPPHKKEGHTRE